LPFFVLGLHLERRHLELVRDRFPRSLALAVLAAILVFAAYIEDFARAAVVYSDAVYGDLGYASGEGMQIRAVVLAIGLLGAVSVMSLVPRGRSWFTTLGSAKRVVYLFHGFAVKYVDYAGWLDVGESQPTLALA